MTSPADRAFAAWACASCPPPVAILRSIAAALDVRAAPDVEGELDDLGRRLFDVAGDTEAAGARLAELVAGFAVDEASPAGLLLDEVLTRRAGHPQLLAVVLAEAGRRAGFTAGVVSSPGRWYAAIAADEQRTALVAPSDPLCRRRPSLVRRHCGHQIAFAALLGLRSRYRDSGDEHRAERAAALLLRLGFDADGDDRAVAGADPLHVLWS